MLGIVASQCSGTRKANKQVIAELFRIVGAAVGHMEDPAEDVFSGRVCFENMDFTVLEGVFEANCFHLQHMLSAIEAMPDKEPFSNFKLATSAILKLSQVICDRSKVVAYQMTNDRPLSGFPMDAVKTLKGLSSRVIFTNDDLLKHKIDKQSLSEFSSSLDSFQDLSNEEVLKKLERFPIVLDEDCLIVANPSCIGVAIRRMILDFFSGNVGALILERDILNATMRHLAVNQFFLSDSRPQKGFDLTAPFNAMIEREVQPGFWYQIIFVADNLEGFTEEGFDGTSAKCFAASGPVEAEIRDARTRCSKKDGFRQGITLIVLLGYGRGMGLGFYDEHDDWFVEGISAYDFETLGWIPRFKIGELFKILRMRKKLKTVGFRLKTANGLLNLVALMKRQKGHLVPHSDLPDGLETAVLTVPTNELLALRKDHHHRLDTRKVVAPDGSILAIRRRDSGSRAPGGVCRIYVAMSDASKLRYRAVWLDEKHQWWVNLIDTENLGSEGYRLFELTQFWLERVGYALRKIDIALPKQLNWEIKFPPFKPRRASFADIPTDELINACVTSEVNCRTRTIRTSATDVFHTGMLNPKNKVEKVFARSLLEAILELSKDNNADIEELLDIIVPNDNLRQLHMFAPQDFRDEVRNHQSKEVIFIREMDHADLKLGLGWPALARPGGTISGVENCTRALNAIVEKSETDLCKDVGRFNRKALITRLLDNIESAADDRSRWLRTYRANAESNFSTDQFREEIFETLTELNMVGLASRIIIEVALCEAPETGGIIPASLDVSRLMAQAVSLHTLGGTSDVIYYGGMRPDIRISPAGEVEIDHQFYDTIMDGVGSSFAGVQLKQSDKNYDELHRMPDLVASDELNKIDAKFLEAWNEEVGVVLNEFRDAVETLENEGAKLQKRWFEITHAEFINLLSKKISNPEAFLAALELSPRDGWKTISPPFTDEDRQPWRFRRRLSVAQRPILRVGTEPQSNLIIAPAIIREAFLILVSGYYHGTFLPNRMTSKKMKSWRGHTTSKEGLAFNKTVSDALELLGWTTRTDIEFPEILGRPLSANPGDIDVLAWKNTGKIIIIECKDLMFAKTAGEMAKQLSEFAGVTIKNGKPDRLLKHLNRVELAKENIDEFRRFTKLPNATIEHALVLANTTPMNFATETIGKKTTVLTVQHLDEL